MQLLFGFCVFTNTKQITDEELDNYCHSGISNRFFS